MVILYTSNKGNFINLKNITISEMESKGIKKNIYVNLTNRCPCACTFCLRATKKMSETNSLWLEKEPTAEEVITEAVKKGTAIGYESGPSVQAGMLTNQHIIEQMFQDIISNGTDPMKAAKEAEKQLNDLFEAAQ